MTAETTATHHVDPSASQAMSESEAQGFASVLRDRTHTVHREAERSGYIADLLRGRANKAGYALYLASLLPAYDVMERQLETESTIPALKAFSAPGLFRQAALRHDIAALAAPDSIALPVGPEAQAYADAIAAQGQGVGLVAHAYARYLGDLSGGQILKPLLARTLGLTPDQLTFYDFPDIEDIARCKAGLRDALDMIEPGSRDAEHVVQESIAAFRHTIAISTAVSNAMSGSHPEAPPV